MAATRGDSGVGIGESRTATRSSESERVGLGIVKEMNREGLMVSKVATSSAIARAIDLLHLDLLFTSWLEQNIIFKN